MCLCHVSGCVEQNIQHGEARPCNPWVGARCDVSCQRPDIRPGSWERDPRSLSLITCSSGTPHTPKKSTNSAQEPIEQWRVKTNTTKETASSAHAVLLPSTPRGQAPLQSARRP